MSFTTDRNPRLVRTQRSRYGGITTGLVKESGALSDDKVWRARPIMAISNDKAQVRARSVCASTAPGWPHSSAKRCASPTQGTSTDVIRCDSVLARQHTPAKIALFAQSSWRHGPETTSTARFSIARFAEWRSQRRPTCLPPRSPRPASSSAPQTATSSGAHISTACRRGHLEKLMAIKEFDAYLAIQIETAMEVTPSWPTASSNTHKRSRTCWALRSPLSNLRSRSPHESPG